MLWDSSINFSWMLRYTFIDSLSKNIRNYAKSQWIYRILHAFVIILSIIYINFNSKIKLKQEQNREQNIFIYL